MNKRGAEYDDRCDMGHNTYGVVMRQGLWRAHCGCGWQSRPSPDVGAETARLDEHLRHTVAAAQRRLLPDERRDGLPLRALDRNIFLGAVALGMALFGAVAGWVDHDVDGA